jgi:hypothetical protein
LVLLIETGFIEQIPVLQVEQVLLVFQQLLAFLVHPELHLEVAKRSIETNAQEIIRVLVGIAVFEFSAFENVDI